MIDRFLSRFVAYRRFFCVIVHPASRTWGPRINRYGPSVKGSRLIELAVYCGTVGISVGKYTP